MTKHPSTSRQSLSLFWRYTNRYKLLFWAGTLGALLAVIAQNIIPPLIIAKTLARLQHAYGTHTRLEFGMFKAYFFMFSASMIIGALIWRIQSFCTWRLEILVRRDMANETFNHLLRQSQRFHADRFGGALVSQVNKFTAAHERLVDDFIWNIVPGTTTLVFSVGVLLFVSYKYAIVLLSISMLYMFIMVRRMRHQMPYNVAEATAESKQTAALSDAITNMSTIRSFAGEEFERQRFNGVVGELYTTSGHLSIEVLKTEALSHFQTNSFSIVAFLFGLIAVTQFQANVSLLYLVLTYTQGLTGQLWQFGRLIRNLNRAFGDASEMTAILHIEPEVQDASKIEPSTIHRGSIHFDNVRFHYSDNRDSRLLFDGLTLKIKPGEKVGLVGHSGGGKTTLARLLLRFMDIQGGTISIDGQNIAGIRQADLRSNIAYVPQEPMLFHRSLLENIRYGSPEASDQAVVAVAKMAHAHEFISELKDGYQTMVGERGVKLSGGQRQRVAIARAMLKNAPILVLDEATSALDSESEALIQEALWRLMEGRTAIVVAHRLSTVQRMDRIIVLEQGHIVEEGGHKDLIYQNGAYANLWHRQSGGFIEE
ncbi:MAG: ABC transporter ATP-binding protein [Candidatus Saccharimonadales bacterium]